MAFLGATKHLYKRVCPSVGPSVGPSVRRSVTPSLKEVLRSTYSRVSGLVFSLLERNYFSIDFLASCSQSIKEIPTLGAAILRTTPFEQICAL